MLNFREWLISSTYKTPFINFIFSTKDLIIPKFLDFEEYRNNIQKYKKKYICHEILNLERQIIKSVEDIPENKTKYLLLDIGLAYNELFKNNEKRKNNLLIIVDNTDEYFEIIFINTPDLYQNDYSYVRKKYYKNEEFFEKNLKNISFLFMFYSFVTNGISVISKNKIDFLNDQDVYYLTKNEQKEIFKKMKPFEHTRTTIFRFINIFFFFLLPFIMIDYTYFNYKFNLDKNIKIENRKLHNQIINNENDINKLKNKYNNMLGNIKDKRKFFNLEEKKEK